MTADQAMERFSQEYLELTCSVVCDCQNSVFFQGQVWNESIPASFKCPYCNTKVQVQY